jgi:RNA polymerase-binding transcription factor DksA
MKCAVCGNEIHPKRLEIVPGTRTCAKHSTTGKYRCMTVQYGEGDHTYDDVIILKEEDAWQLEQSEKTLRKNIEKENEKDFEADLVLSPDLNDTFVETIAKNADILEDKDSEDKDSEEEDFLPDDPYLE